MNVAQLRGRIESGETFGLAQESRQEPASSIDNQLRHNDIRRFRWDCHLALGTLVVMVAFVALLVL